MDILFHSSNVDIREMSYDDIPLICKADNDESDRNIAYLNNQLKNQDNHECSALIALYNGKVAGYVFLYYKCRWGGLAHQILTFPSISDNALKISPSWNGLWIR